MAVKYGRDETHTTTSKPHPSSTRPTRGVQDGITTVEEAVRVTEQDLLTAAELIRLEAFRDQTAEP